MKPRSAGNSPSSATRRRATVTPNAMQGLPNQYQSSLEAALLTSAFRNPRPISWHPSSARTRGISNPIGPLEVAQENYGMGPMVDPSLNMNALSVYGSENMMSYPMSAGATMSPDSYVPFYLDSHDALSHPQQAPSLSIPSSQVEPMVWDGTASAVDLSNMTQTTSDGWSLDMLSMANIPPAETTCPSYASVPSPGELSGPSTPDFLPIQQFDDDPASPQGKKDGKPEEELVGMGLYSQPDGPFGQPQQGILGKGLKLEETFSPSDEEVHDGSQDAEEEEYESDPVSQSGPEQSEPMTQPNLSVPRQPSRPGLNLLHKSFFFDHDDLDQQTMTAAQPFASLNQSCMTYGYGWI